MDPFDDIFAPVTTNVRAGGKFQPKLRQQPRKPTLASAPKLVPCGNSSGPSSAEVSGTRNNLSSIDVKTKGLKETRDENSGNRLSQSGVGFFKVDTDQLIDSSKEIVSSNVPSSGLDTEPLARLSDVGKSAIENVDIFSELECLDDFIPQTTTETGNEESPSQSKLDTDSKQAEKFLTSYGIDPEVPNSMLPAEDLTVQAHCSIDSSEFTMCEVVPPQNGPEYEKVPAENERTEIVVAETFFDFDTSEATVLSGQHSGKFKPRPNPSKGKDKVSTHDHLADVGYSLPSEEAADLVSSNNECIREVPTSDYSLEDCIDISPTRLVNTSSSMLEIQMNEEPTSFMEAICSNGAGNADGQTELVEHSTETNHQKKFKPSKQLRNRLKQILEEPEDESPDDPAYEPPTTSNRDEDENNDDACVADNTSRKRKAPRKAKEPPLPGNEKTVTKGKRGKKASEELANEPPRKKFSHSSRRNKRTVDKALLDTPEDEIDTQRVPIRDLILLAEHRERMMIKDAAKQKTPQANQRVDDSLREDAYREEDLFSAEHGQYSDEDQPRDRVQPTAVYVNYQTYMDKKPGGRWSKIETELFYEAVRQFGTDFTMIQKLFPNRTRGQVKSKFKKEERQNPLLLSDAAMNRAKDHTHFEFVIEQLQKDAAAKQESCGVYSAAMSGEEDAYDDANEVGTKPDQNDEATVEQESEVVEAQNSQLKSDKSEEEDEDDDLDKWNQYNY